MSGYRHSQPAPRLHDLTMPVYRDKVFPDVPAGQIRCPHCGQLIAKGVLAPGTSIQIKCHRCKEMSDWNVL